MPLPILPPPPPFPGSLLAVNQWLADDFYPYVQAIEPRLIRLEEIALFDVAFTDKVSQLIEAYLSIRSRGRGSDRNLHDDIRDIVELLTSWRQEFLFYLANRPQPLP